MSEVSLHLYSADLSTILSLPIDNNAIRAGFPSPAGDYTEDSIDLNRELIRHKETTFYARVVGDSMMNAGICDGDLVVIDKSLDVRDGDYIAAYVDGGFTLKQFKHDSTNKCGWLVPANPDYESIRVDENNDFRVWGVVTSVIHQFR